MKRAFLAVTLILAFTFIPFCAVAMRSGLTEFSGGSGTAADPYIITTAAELDEVRNNLTAHYKLGNDIDLSEYLAPGGAGCAKWGAMGWEPIGNYNTKDKRSAFSGNFNGDGHIITGLWIDRSDTDYVSFFEYADGAEITNLGVVIASTGIKGRKCVGGLVGVSFSNIKNCYSKGNVSGSEGVGGLIGVSDHSGNVENCYATGEVNGSQSVGGLVGGQWESFIKNCFAIGNVNGSEGVGGLVGISDNSSIENCYATSNVRGRDGVGGLVGGGSGNITNCYATGDVNGSQNLGGLAGSQGDGYIINCYANVNVSGRERIGGLIGLQDGNVINCYATGNVRGEDAVGGLIGYQNSDVINCYATGDVNGNQKVGSLVGWQLYDITNCYRYINQKVNDAVIPPDNSASAPDKRNGGVKTAPELMTQTTYSDIGWLFYPTGPWHWDSENFPKLNIGEEKFPFGFSPSMEAVISIITQPANVLVTQGNISNNLTVVADTIPSGTLNFQWYSTTTNNNAGGILIEGETSAKFMIPTALVAGTYYYFCEIIAVNAETVRTNVITVSVFSDGSGDDDDPYIITTAAELDTVRNNLSAHYRLGNNIDLSEYLAPGGAGCNKWGTNGWEPIGDYSISIIKNNKYFSGSLNGNGYLITGMWIDRSDTDSVGLFGHTNNAEIVNLGVEIASAGIRGRNFAGGLVGTLIESSIKNCYATGYVSGDYDVGGLVGNSENSSVTNSYATGSFSSRRSAVGGLVGNSNICSIENCYAIGNVSGGLNVGGLVGQQRKSSIEKCYAKADVRGNGTVGGLLGSQEDNSSTTNSYATGSVSGETHVGGLVGIQTECSIKNCYAVGNVTATSFIAGGLVGQQSKGSVTNSYSTGNVSGDGYGTGGLVGYQENNSSTINSYATGNVSASEKIGGLVGWQLASNITNCYRYINQKVNDAVIPPDNPESAHDKTHGGVRTASELMTQTTYSDNDWLFYPTGPWHWDSENFPKLNIGVENFPFKFKDTDFLTFSSP